MAIKLAHVCIETDNLEKTEHFYTLLGMQRRFDFKNLQGELVGFYLAFDNTSYIEVIKVAGAGQPGNLAHFAIETDDIDALRGRLIKAGFSIEAKELGKDQSWMIKLRDPNGIFIECHQYTEASFQQCGGTCEVDYQPGKSATPA